MKKISIMLLSLLCTLLCTVASSANGATVTVTIADGTLKLPAAVIYVTDIDGDGKLTIDDALRMAHVDTFDSDVYYESFMGDYGRAISKLWGNEAGVGFGYYLNNASAMNLEAEIKDGDIVSAFVYNDTVNYSDVYCYFDKTYVEGQAGGKAKLTLMASGFDANWAPITTPLAGAEITLDGVKTGILTDANGAAEIALTDAGRHVISALSDTMTLVPPACVVEVGVSAPETNDAFIGAVILAALSLGCAIATKKRK